MAALPNTAPTLNRQLSRAAALKIDAPHIATPAKSQPAAGQQFLPRAYQQYTVGYAAGTELVYLPALTANPAPVHNQYAHTSAHPYSHFAVNDLPPILFRLEPFLDTFTVPHSNPVRDVAVPMLYDATTRQQIMTARGAPLRFFSFLPRYVAHDIPGCLLEFWFRLDYRLEMNDIRMRMEADPANRIPDGNALNMRRVRFREAIKGNAWGSCRTWPVQVDIERLDIWTAEQICLNTTMIVDMANHRLLKPTFAANNLNCTPPAPGSNQTQRYVDSGLPLDHFLSNPMDTIPSRRMIARIVLRQRLQTLALRTGLGNHSTAYANLPKQDDPAWWHDKEKGNSNLINPDGRSIHEIDDLNHRQFMEREFGNSDFSGVRPRNSVRGNTRMR